MCDILAAHDSEGPHRYVLCNTLVVTLFCVNVGYILVTYFTCSIHVLQYSTIFVTFLPITQNFVLLRSLSVTHFYKTSDLCYNPHLKQIVLCYYETSLYHIDVCVIRLCYNIYVL